MVMKSDVILSICIPTFDRPQYIEELINDIITSDIQDLEIVISDDNPNSIKTRQVVDKFKDPRIKYFQNNINLGFDGNQLIAIHRAKGKYVFLLMDDDDIEVKALPWIVEKIRNKNELTYICGSLGNKVPKLNRKYYYRFPDKKFENSYEPIKRLIFQHYHCSGIVLKKDAINLKQALRYVGILFIQQVLVAQAMIKGHTLSTLKIFAYYSKKDNESRLPPIYKNSSYRTLIGHIIIAKHRINIIHDIIRGIQKEKQLRKILINRQFRYIYANLNEALSISFKKFIYYILIVFTIEKLRFNPKFWTNLIKDILYHVFKSKYYTKYRPIGHLYGYYEQRIKKM